MSEVLRRSNKKIFTIEDAEHAEENTWVFLCDLCALRGANFILLGVLNSVLGPVGMLLCFWQLSVLRQAAGDIDRAIAV